MNRGLIKFGGSLLNCPEQIQYACRWLANDCQSVFDSGPMRSSRGLGLQTIVVFGGGMVADSVRQLDSSLCLPEQVSHLAALETMRATSRIGAALVPNSCWCDDIDSLNSSFAPSVVFDCSRWIMARQAAAGSRGENFSPPNFERNTRGQATVTAEALAAEYDQDHAARRSSPNGMGTDVPDLRCEHRFFTWDFTSDSISALLALELGLAELVLLKRNLFSEARSLAALAETGAVDACFPDIAARLERVWIVAFDSAGFALKRCLSTTS